MEHEYFDFDSVPNDVWRLILSQLSSLRDLRSFNAINKSCHNSSRSYLQRERIWLRLFNTRFGLDRETNFIPFVLPSKLFQLHQILRPSLNIKHDATLLQKPLKIVVLGDGGTGKTSFCKLVSGAQVEKRYLPTIGVEVQKFNVVSNNQIFEVVLWDTGAGPEKFGILRDGYYIGAAAAIILSDVTSRITMQNVSNWARDIERVCGPIPVAFCVNKVDYKPETASPRSFLSLVRLMRLAKKNNAMFCEMSVWSQHGVHEALAWILQQLAGDETLTFQFPPMHGGELRAKVNDLIMSAVIKARDRFFNEPIEQPDVDIDDPTPIEQPSIALPKSDPQQMHKILNEIISSCSPRVKNVMNALLTGVRSSPVITTNHHPLQKPSLMFVEGLTCQEFHPLHTFNFVQPFLDFYWQHEDAILAETKALMGTPDLDSITSSVQGSWKSFYFLESGQINQKSHEAAPLMTQLLQRVASLMTCSFGYAYISILGPHSHITPHCGPCNIKLRCHLPLVVPNDSCTIRVGSTTKQFKQGELLIFDDSIEHEVRNDSSVARVILLFDIWHPDLTADEINSFKAYFK